MTSQPKSPEGGKPADRQAEREAKLAQALRANLRRRKADAPAKPGSSSEGSESA